MLSIGLSVMVTVAIATADGGLAETARRVIRWTARSSLVLFAPVYLARPAQQLWRNAITKWLLAERKWVGLSFAVSHTFHLCGILVFAASDYEGFAAGRSIATAAASAALLLIAAMVVTSIESVKARMSRASWKRLHQVGIHSVWVIFAATYVPAAARDVWAASGSAALLAMVGVRGWAHVRNRE